MLVRNMIMGILASLGAVVPILPQPAAQAAEWASDEEILQASHRLDDAELAGARGGFEVAGLNISLGADLRTYVNGDLALRTLMTWGDGKVTSEQPMSATISPATAQQLQAGFLSTGSIRMAVGNQPVVVANDGATAVLHDVDNGLRNIVVNTASNTTIRQELDLTVDVSGYAAFRDGLIAGMLPHGLEAAINAMGVGVSLP
ncbi:MAG: hypothetical protein J0G94_14650 [Sphingomonadales bacterium]|nr:hypothetical protein [Sphingomonadales bacterium]